MNVFSSNPAYQSTTSNPTEYELYSDRHERLYSKYILDNGLRLRPKPETPVVNFKQLKDILLSKDLSRASELDWTVDGFRFLDGEELTVNKVAFQSYPRSGNTMMRTFIETVTGLFTGSDTILDASINLQTLGLCGEETTCDSNLVWVTKTHWPNPHGWKETFHAQKMIVQVRNPIDVIPSFSNLTSTTSHSLKPQQSFNEDFPEYWDKFIDFAVDMMKKNHE